MLLMQEEKPPEGQVTTKPNSRKHLSCPGNWAEIWPILEKKRPQKEHIRMSLTKIPCGADFLEAARGMVWVMVFWEEFYVWKAAGTPGWAGNAAELTEGGMQLLLAAQGKAGSLFRCVLMPAHGLHSESFNATTLHSNIQIISAPWRL